MSNRILLVEVPDVQTEDDLVIAIEVWNDRNPDREINYKKLYSCPVGESF